MAQFGSLTNLLMNRSKTVTPEVGMGVTELCWSDRRPYTIVEIVSPKRIIVQADKATRTDKNFESESQAYEYSPNPDAPRVTLTLRSNGKWAKQGESSKGAGWIFGLRQAYHDFSF
jgi:hypothetical protein